MYLRDGLVLAFDLSACWLHYSGIVSLQLLEELETDTCEIMAELYSSVLCILFYYHGPLYIKVKNV